MLEVEAADDEDIADPNTRVAELARLEIEAAERLARRSKMALDAGVAERLIRMVRVRRKPLSTRFRRIG